MHIIPQTFNTTIYTLDLFQPSHQVPWLSRKSATYTTVLTCLLHVCLTCVVHRGVHTCCLGDGDPSHARLSSRPPPDVYVCDINTPTHPPTPTQTHTHTHIYTQRHSMTPSRSHTLTARTTHTFANDTHASPLGRPSGFVPA